MKEKGRRFAGISVLLFVVLMIVKVLCGELKISTVVNVRMHTLVVTSLIYFRSFGCTKVDYYYVVVYDVLLYHTIYILGQFRGY